MLLSMTGFGKGVAENSSRKFTVEIKTLNSKQLDFSSRMPSVYREMEVECRNLVASRIERGKVDLAVTVETLGATSDISINMERAAAYKAQIERMSQELGLPAPADWYSVLLRMPDVMHTDCVDTIDDDDRATLLKAVEAACDALRQFRAKEGKKLEEFFASRISHIAGLLAEVPKYEAERITRIRARIEDALSQIPQADYDRGRYEQEMIFYIEKLDINEEKQRLAQHLEYFTETMGAEPGQGKKLGFISQEMGREINTLGSKSNHAEMQITVVKMKDELEQIKEQVLNVL
ncbi:YicC family protein [Muribaculaceae bacterium Isolate-002 (NCI)]|nr:YicC family protein [Muribaculaceae bacterium Isolate-002 (NCI)]